MDGILKVMREYAADPDTLPEGSAFRDWGLEVNSAVTRLKAYTRELSPDPDAAWRTALQLRDAIVAEGCQLRGPCEVGTVVEDGPGPDFAATGWRGYVNLLFTTKAD